MNTIKVCNLNSIFSCLYLPGIDGLGVGNEGDLKGTRPGKLTNVLSIADCEAPPEVLKDSGSSSNDWTGNGGCSSEVATGGS